MAKMQNDANQLTPPAWAGDFLNREHLVPGGAKLDASAFLASDGTPAVVVTVGAAGALAAATSVPVDALSGAIPDNTLLDFGSNKFARLAAAAAAGATSLTTDAIPTALVDNDTATYPGTPGELSKNIPSGTFLGRTFAERETDDPFGPADAADEEFYLLAFDVTDADNNADCELYRHGSIVKENFLPGWATMSAGLKADLRANYATTKGVN